VLEILPLIYICGSIEYHYRITISENLFEFLSAFIGYGINAGVLLLLIIIYVLIFKQNIPQRELGGQKYEEARRFFRSEYDLCNPITQ